MSVAKTLSAWLETVIIMLTPTSCHVWLRVWSGRARRAHWN